MYQADLKHSRQTLQQKLEALYSLNREKILDLGFRPPFLNLVKAFGNPHLSLPPTIHVAGTNGKGSIVAMLRSILEAQRKTVSAYTSPHLHEFNERLYVSGAYITNDELETLINEAIELNHGGAVTFFEITTAMAFAAFARKKADYCLLEVGLGGRLDCTNIIENPAATVIANISFDHQEFLGNTLPEIAAEKAGIMKSGSPCIIGYQTPESIKAGVMNVFDYQAAQTSAPLFRAGIEWHATPYNNNQMLFVWDDTEYILPRPKLLGDHQIENAGAALAALFTINETGDLESLSKGLTNIYWPARLENVSRCFDDPELEIWYDGGCNDSAGAAIETQIKKWEAQDDKEFHLVVGMKGDKDSLRFLSYLTPHAKSITIIPPTGLPDYLRTEKVEGAIAAKNLKDAVQKLANQNPEIPKRILITGSLYLRQEIVQTTPHR